MNSAVFVNSGAYTASDKIWVECDIEGTGGIYRDVTLNLYADSKPLAGPVIIERELTGTGSIYVYSSYDFIPATVSGSVFHYIATNSIRGLSLTTVRAVVTATNVANGQTVTFYDDTQMGIYRFFNHRAIPKIDVFSISRWSNGAADDSGIYAAITCKLSNTGTFDANTDSFSCVLYWSNTTYPTNVEYPSIAQTYPQTDLSSHISDMVTTGVVDEDSYISSTFLNSSPWYFTLFYGDEYEFSTATFSISKAFANMHLSGAQNGGVAFGMFSTSTNNDPKFESGYKGYFYNGINGVTDYSTSEVLTGGRWIDDKPIYRKVLTVNTSTNQHSIDVSDLDIDQIIYMYGIVNFSDPGYSYQTTLPDSQNNVNYNITLMYNVSIKAITVGSTSRTMPYCHVIVEYTKQTI